MEEEYLLLKWGTLKGWFIEDEETFTLLKDFFSDGMTIGCMGDKPEEDRKNILCQIIDRINGEIHNDWSGEKLTKEDAKKYIMEYPN